MTSKHPRNLPPHRRNHIHPLLPKRRNTNTEPLFNNDDEIGNKKKAQWPWKAEINFCHRCVQLINLGRMERGIITLEPPELDDLQKELIKITGVKYKHYSLQNKWNKLRLNNDDTKIFENMEEGQRAEYFEVRKRLFPDAKSGSHLNGEKTDAVNIESDNVINLEDEKANDFEPHGVTQSSPSSSIASLADNCPTIPTEDTENILVNQTWVDAVEEEEDLEEASRECKRRKMSDQGRKALGWNLMNLPILSPPTEVVAPSSSGGPKALQEASIEPSPYVPEKAPTAQPALDEVEFREKQAKGEVATGFSITRCISVLKTMRGITTAEKVKAFDVFKLAENREIFINAAADEDGTNEDGTARMWLQSQMAKLP